jgi:hypothetical protein
MTGRPRGERGATVVMVAMVLGALILVAALVVDMGGARSDQRANVVTADSAALAGAAELASSGSAACTAAWKYVMATVGASAAAPACSSLAAACSTSTAVRRVSATIEDLTVTFTHPVPAADPLMGTQPVTASDGAACDRFGVRIRQVHGEVLGGTPTTVSSSAVARLGKDTGTAAVAALVVLNKTRCNALASLGSAVITVTATATTPGRIVTDSDASACLASEVVIDTNNTASITAQSAGTSPGVVSAYALTTRPVNAFQASDNINPKPTAQARQVTRSPVDWRYNCKTANACPTPAAPYVDQLVTAHSGTGLPTGFTRYSTTYSCSIAAKTTVTVPVGKWWVDCTSGLDIKGTLLFRGGTVVLDKAPVIGSGGVWGVGCTLAACTNDPDASTVYLRSGNLDLSGGVTIRFNETFAYVTSPGTVTMGGNSTISWKSPVDGDFEDLLVWAETTATVSLGGGPTLALEGTFFIPNSLFDVQGSSGTTGVATQVFADRVVVQGSGRLILSPVEGRLVTIGVNRTYLVR